MTRREQFLEEMELALGAATAAVSRSGASSLAELAALRPAHGAGDGRKESGAP